jgi:hypothetical protein
MNECSQMLHLESHFLSKYFLLFFVCFIFKEGVVVICVLLSYLMVSIYSLLLQRICVKQ